MFSCTHTKYVVRKYAAVVKGFFSFFFFLFLFVCRELQTFGAREQRENTCQAVVLGPL